MGQYIAPSKQNPGRVSMAHQRLTINVNVDNSNFELSDEQFEQITNTVINNVKNQIDVNIDPETLAKIEQNASNIESLQNNVTTLQSKDRVQDNEIAKKANQSALNSAVETLNTKIDNIEITGSGITEEEVEGIVNTVKADIQTDIDTINDNITGINETVDDINKKIEDINEDITTLDTNVNELSNKIGELPETAESVVELIKQMDDKNLDNDDFDEIVGSYTGREEGTKTVEHTLDDLRGISNGETISDDDIDNLFGNP